MSKLIIGLTGGIGSGKSTVARLFAAKGIRVVDADQCSRIVVEPGKPALQKIAGHFGETILLDDGALNRPRLRQIIFDNPTEKQWLEALLHPLIFEEIIHQLKSAESPYAVLESPLLIEAGQSAICHRVLAVDVAEEQQIERAMKRDNNSRELIEAILRSQASRQQRLAAAHDIIDNSGADPALLQSQVDRLHEKYLLAAKAITTTAG